VLGLALLDVLERAHNILGHVLKLEQLLLQRLQVLLLGHARRVVGVHSAPEIECHATLRRTCARENEGGAHGAGGGQRYARK